MEQVNRAHRKSDFYRDAAAITGGAAAALGVLGLSAWLSGLQILSSLISAYIPMAPDTALIFAALGSNLLLAARRPLPNRGRAFLALIVALASVYGLLKFIEYFVKVDLTLENVLFPVTGQLGSFPINRMSPITGVLFLLCGIALLSILWDGGSNRARNLVGGLGILVFISGFVATTGYLFASPLLYGGDIIPLAATTALAFLFLGIGLVAAAGPTDIFVRPLVGSSVQARMLRAFLPLTATVVLVEGILHEVITKLSDVNHALLSAVFSLIFVAITAVVVTQRARVLSQAIDVAELKHKQAEEDLLKFKLGIERSEEAIFVTDINGIIVYVNPGFEKIYSYTRAEALGKTPRILKSGVLRREAYEHFWNVLLAKQVIAGELINRTRDGRFLNIEGSANPILSEGGNILGFLAIQRDITERKRTEEALARRAREMAALYATTRDLATPKDLLTLLQTIVEGAVALLEAHGGSIFLYDADHQDLEIVVTAGPELPVGTRFAIGEGMAGRVAQTLTPLIVDDYRTWEHRSPKIGEIPFSATIEVPMLYGGELIGVLAVDEVGDTTHKFTEADARLLSLFASHAAGAVRNARLFEESQCRLRETLLLNRVLAAASSALEPNAVLTTICQELAHALHLPHSGFALINADGTHLTVVAEYCEEGRPSSLGAVIPIIGNQATRYAIEHRQPVVVSDTQTDERQSVIHELEKQLDIASLLILPVVSRDQVIGTLGLAAGESRDFNPDEIALAQHLTAAASQAFENAQLYAAIQQELAERKRTEEALAKERNILRTLIDSMPDYIYVKDTESRFVVGNLAIAHSFGKTSPEEIYGQSDFDYHAPELAALFFADEQAIFRTGQPLINREEFVFEPAGNQRWLITTKMPLRDSQGNILGLVGVGRDITERRQAEQALEQSEKKYRQLVETLQEGIWVIDREAFTTFVNPRMAEMLGYGIDEMLGRHLFSFMDERDIETGKRYLERRQLGIREHHDFEFLRKDGSRIFTSLEAAPIVEESGDYAGAIAGVTDLTERKKAEEALKASEQYARNIIDSSLDMIISVDRERRIVEFNHAAETAFGYIRDEVLGKNISLLYSDSVEGQSVHQTTLERGILVREILNRRKNGEVFPSLLSAAVMEDDKGERIGVVGVSRDITESRRAEEALRRRLAELGALHTVAVASVEAPDEDTLIERATQVVGESLFPDNFGVLHLDPSCSSLRIHPSYSADAAIKDRVVPIHQGLTGQVAVTGKPVRCGDVLNQPGYLQLDARIRSELCVPLKVGDRILGVINAESARSYAFTDADERLMVTLASQLASAIDRLRTQAELRRLATIDELTCVFNRRYFFQLARREFDRSQRLGHPLSAIMFDIDHFKAVNDRYGHAVGDEVLQAVVATCLKDIREIDLLGRYGGEEFTILLVECDLSNSLEVAERFRASIGGHEIPTTRGPVRVTVSVGIAQLKADTEDITSLVDCADAAMYAAKAAGRNRVAVG